jgi:hypothetical protein
LADTVAKVENRTTLKISRSRFLDADAVLYLASDRSSSVNGDETGDGSYANMLMNLVPRPGYE